jgi:DNA-binding response OmpR family regulator
VSARNPKILVCDDDDGIRGMLLAFLDGEGFEVASVPDGPSCLAAVEADPPDIVVLDVMMPGMDGYQVLEALRRDHSGLDLKVVMLTARTSDADIWHGWTSGVDYYISKPFDPEELIRFLHFLAHRSGTAAPAE